MNVRQVERGEASSPLPIFSGASKIHLDGVVGESPVAHTQTFAATLVMTGCRHLSRYASEFAHTIPVYDSRYGAARPSHLRHSH